jgi:hypothetical protein
MEINLLLRTNDLKELEDFVHMMQAFPKIRQAMTIEQDIENMMKKAELLRVEIQSLEQYKTTIPPQITVTVPPPVENTANSPQV